MAQNCPCGKFSFCICIKKSYSGREKCLETTTSISPSARVGPGGLQWQRGRKKTLITNSTAVSSISIPTKNLRSEEHTSELQSHLNLVCRLLLEKKKK